MDGLWAEPRVKKRPISNPSYIICGVFGLYTHVSPHTLLPLWGHSPPTRRVGDDFHVFWNNCSGTVVRGLVLAELRVGDLDQVEGLSGVGRPGLRPSHRGVTASCGPPSQEQPQRYRKCWADKSATTPKWSDSFLPSWVLLITPREPTAQSVVALTDMEGRRSGLWQAHGALHEEAGGQAAEVAYGLALTAVP